MTPSPQLQLRATDADRDRVVQMLRVAAEEGALTVRLPLRVAASHHHKVRGMSQSRLRRLLRKVPAYAQLLEENPYSRVSVADRPP